MARPGRRNVRTFVSNFSLFIYIYIYLFFQKTRGNLIGHLSPATLSQGVVGRALLDLPVRGERVGPNNPSLRPAPSTNNRLFNSEFSSRDYTQPCLTCSLLRGSIEGKSEDLKVIMIMNIGRDAFNWKLKVGYCWRFEI